MKKVCIFTSTRADFGLLSNLIYELKKKNIETNLIATGTHFSKKYGNTFKEIQEKKIKIKKSFQLKINTNNETGIANIISETVKNSSKIIKKIKPKLILILGDRYEIFSIAVAAHLQNSIIAHLHGGELTYGAIDDAFRHSITKMAHLHFVTTEAYRKRVIQLGEDPKKVFNFGALGVDNIKKMILKKKDFLERTLNIKFNSKNVLLTFHPETINQSKKKVIRQVNEILSALKELKDTSIFITKPGAELYSDIIIEKFKKFSKKNKNCYFFSSLGQENYFSMLSNVDLMIGNSSSGIIEMPSFKKTTINLGLRQSGRIKPKTVIDTKIDKKDILKSIKIAYSLYHLNKIKNLKNPYKKNNTAEKISKVIKNINLKKINKFKNFYDL